MTSQNPRTSIGQRLLASALLAATSGCGPSSPAPEPTPAPAPKRAPSGPAQPIVWTKLASTSALDATLAEARRLGRPTVVIVWAAWAAYAKGMTRTIDGDDALRRTLSGATTLMLDGTADDGEAKSVERDLRAALKIPENRMPWVAFVDGAGVRRADLDIDGYDAAAFRAILAARLAALGLRDE